MSRNARFLAEGAYYHIMNRGNNKQITFKENSDYIKFTALLKKYLRPPEINIVHYVLMRNHYHLIIRLEKPQSLRHVMQKLNQTYARHFRSRYGGAGYFWQSRYKSFLIENGKYLLECGGYIELNPVRAGISAAPEDYPWSSYHYYGEGKRDGLITAANPEYERFSEDMQSRIDIYREYLKGRMNDRRKLERYFKNGVYGSELFESQMRDKGLIPVWSHAGRPKKKNN